MNLKQKKWFFYFIECILWLLFLSIPFLFLMGGPPRGEHPHLHGMGHDHGMHRPPNHGFKFIVLLIANIVFIAVYAFNNYVLIPRLYFKKKYVQYVLVLVSIFLLINGLQLVMEMRRGAQFHFKPPTIIHFFMTLLVLIVPLGLQLYKRLMTSEKEKTIAELSFLKSQINHHFLFNSLNNIYSLSIQESKSTPKAIHSLSFIMRYILDEAVKEQTSLAKELDYMHHYISLQRLRLSDKAKLDYEALGDPANLNISPMLLIPFVENCFKHGLSTVESCEIDIKINIEQNKITLQTKNKIFRNIEHSGIESGIGIKNVVQRLEMDYPGKYGLTYVEADGYYFVDLNILLV